MGRNYSATLGRNILGVEGVWFVLVVGFAVVGILGRGLDKVPGDSKRKAIF
jgi:hypothetical protein